MTRHFGLIASLSLAVVLSSASAGRQETQNYQIRRAMLEMRVNGAVVEAYRQEHGVYPSAKQQLQPIDELFKMGPRRFRTQLTLVDPWGFPYHYRARDETYQIISFGRDRLRDEPYEGPPVGYGVAMPVVESSEESDDLILFDGRFTKRPFGDDAPVLRTINAMTRISIGSAHSLHQ